MDGTFFVMTGRLAAWRKSIITWAFMRRFFEALGVMWLLAEILAEFAPGVMGWFEGVLGKQQFLPLMLTLAIAWALYWATPRLEKLICIPSIDTNIRLVIGDITKARHAVVVSTNDYFNTSDGLVSEHSVQAKVSKAGFRTIADLDERLQTALGDYDFELDEDPARKGKRNLYKCGTVAKVAMSTGYSAYFLAMAHMHPGGGTVSHVGMLQEALAGLWTRLGTHGDYERVLGIALMGTGAGRVAMSRFNIFRLIVETFVAASSQGKICGELRIYLYAPDLDAKKSDVEEYFSYMEMQEKFPKLEFPASAVPVAPLGEGLTS